MNEDINIDPVAKKLIVLEARKKEIFRGLIIFLLFSTGTLFLRIILRAVGANPQSLFAGLVYVISTIFLLPFLNIFPQFQDMPIAGKPAFDASAAVAIFCYIVLVLVIMAVTYIAIRILNIEKQVDAVVKKDHPVDTRIVNEVIK
jgi:hypothetical protein